MADNKSEKAEQPGETVVISLAGCDKESCLSRFGEALEFGGGPNREVQEDEEEEEEEEGWGMNWDAMFDCLKSLEEGGIWGTSRSFRFPLHLQVQQPDALSEKEYQILLEILTDTKEFYGKMEDGTTDRFTFQITDAEGKPTTYHNITA